MLLVGQRILVCILACILVFAWVNGIGSLALMLLVALVTCIFGVSCFLIVMYLLLVPVSLFHMRIAFYVAA